MENEEFLEYLANQIWEGGILQQKNHDNSNNHTSIKSDNAELFELSDQEIIDKIFNKNRLKQ